MANKEKSLAPLLSALRDLLAWIGARNAKGVIIGGVAASILGRPRFTRDVDLVVLLDQEDWGDFLTAGERFGFVSRRSDALDFAMKTRVLLVHHQPTTIDIDVSFGALPFEEEIISRSTLQDVGGVLVPIPTPEDLIIMKAVAHRPRDLADVEAVSDAHPNLDLNRVRRWVGEFASLLEMPEIMIDLEKILSKRSKRGSLIGRSPKRSSRRT